MDFGGEDRKAPEINGLRLQPWPGRVGDRFGACGRPKIPSSQRIEWFLAPLCRWVSGEVQAHSRPSCFSGFWAILGRRRLMIALTWASASVGLSGRSPGWTLVRAFSTEYRTDFASS